MEELIEMLRYLLTHTIVEHVAMLVENEVVGIAVILLVGESVSPIVVDLADGFAE